MNRKLDEIANNLDDMSVTLEEIKDQVSDNAAPDHSKLDRIHSEITRVGDRIDEIANQEPRRDESEQP